MYPCVFVLMYVAMCYHVCSWVCIYVCLYASLCVCVSLCVSMCVCVCVSVCGTSTDACDRHHQAARTAFVEDPQVSPDGHLRWAANPLAEPSGMYSLESC